MSGKFTETKKIEKKHENSIQRSIRTLWPWRQILNASICKQYEDAWIIFQYSLLYRTVFQAIDGMNKKTAAFLLLRQSQKEGIYIVNVFKTKGRGAVALANIFCWAAALLYAQMASKSVTFSMPFFINAVHSQASLSACLISGCFVFNYQNLCPF